MFHFKLNAIMAKPSILLVSLLCLLGGCANSDDEISEARSKRQVKAHPALGNVELYTHKLANELFAQSSPSRQSRYAVVGFVPLAEQVYNGESHHPLQLLGHQLKEGITTEAAKRGYITQEFLLSDDIRVTADSDSILTRNVEALSDIRRVDFFITGTVLNQELGAIVNARIIHAQTKEVVAAATTFFPAELFWQTESVTSRNGRLVRTQSLTTDIN
ncbi:hypothetical protein J3L16_05350 [Alteromonas sp. 5E99-2]|nr:hypothetical protein [Alteromonas sp. 5E99-2]